MRFESSKLEPGEKTSLDEYASRMKAGSRNIFYLSAPRYSKIFQILTNIYLLSYFLSPYMCFCSQCDKVLSLIWIFFYAYLQASSVIVHSLGIFVQLAVLVAWMVDL